MELTATHSGSSRAVIVGARFPGGVEACSGDVVLAEDVLLRGCIVLVCG